MSKPTTQEYREAVMLLGAGIELTGGDVKQLARLLTHAAELSTRVVLAESRVYNLAERMERMKQSTDRDDLIDTIQKLQDDLVGALANWTLCREDRDQAKQWLESTRRQFAIAERQIAAVRKVLKHTGKHPESCPKGVGIGLYKPPANAVCDCGIDALLDAPPSEPATLNELLAPNEIDR